MIRTDGFQWKRGRLRQGNYETRAASLGLNIGELSSKRRMVLCYFIPYKSLLRSHNCQNKPAILERAGNCFIAENIRGDLKANKQKKLCGSLYFALLIGDRHYQGPLTKHKDKGRRQRGETKDLKRRTIDLQLCSTTMYISRLSSAILTTSVSSPNVVQFENAQDPRRKNCITNI